MNYIDINAKTIDSWVKNGWEWGMSIDHECYINALNGYWNVLLTPTKAVPKEWIGELKGKKLLGLACGGGQQMPIFAACGAICTVLDLSNEQLESERKVSSREGYDISIIKVDMTKPLPLKDEEFDIIFHPVSNCYVLDVEHVFKECFRVLKRGGVLLSGLDNGINFLMEDDDETRIVNRLPYNPLKDEDQYNRSIEKNDGIQFSHTMEEQIGCQLKAGFNLTDIYEDTNGYGKLHELGIPCFVATRSVKPQYRTR